MIIDPKSVWNLLSYSFYERMPHQWRVREDILEYVLSID